jgi:hypothetical protein
MDTKKLIWLTLILALMVMYKGKLGPALVEMAVM